MSTASPTALIAEDELLLAQALKAQLAMAWPQLQVASVAANGLAAVQQALELLPDVLFFDIRMPGLSGIEAAAELTDQWADHAPAGRPFPLLVFVTAYDQYALQAFEAQAVDYLLKPVQPERLQKTINKLQITLAQRAPEATPLDATMAQLRSLLRGIDTPVQSSPVQVLHTIAASVGSTIHMVAVKDICYFEAADKYVRVLTQEREYLIRTPLKELLPQLQEGLFIQVHRGTLVNSACIATVTRDESGRLHLGLRNRPERLGVSRLYAHLFKAM